MTTRMVDVPARSALEAERWFFVYMAFACVAIAFAGFMSRYFAPMAAGRFDAPTLVHIHGLVMWSWTLLSAPGRPGLPPADDCGGIGCSAWPASYCSRSRSGSVRA